MNTIIENTFKEMVSEIQKTKYLTNEPNRYHPSASISELNLVYHFVKQLEKNSDHCVTYLEFPCDSGRIDAVVLFENNILLIEAKTKMDNKKYKVLNAQATRFENISGNLITKNIATYDKYLETYLKDSSFRDTLKDRVYSLMTNKWGIKEDINIYGILLADALSEFQKNKWNHTINKEHYAEYKLECLKQYTLLDTIQDNNGENNIWYLGKYYKIPGTL